MKKIFLFIIIASFYNSLQAQDLFDNYRRNNTTQLTFYATAGLNFGNMFYKGSRSPNRNKGLTSPAFDLGFYYQKDINKHSYMRYGLGFGVSGFGIKYAPKYLPSTDSSYAILSEDKEKESFYIPFIKPHIAYGRYFPIRKNHILEVSLGVGMPIMLTKNSEISDATKSSVNFKKEKATYPFYSYTDMSYGLNGRYYLGDAMLYIGYRNIGKLDDALWNRISMGLQVNYSVLNDKTGRMNVSYIHYDAYLYAQEHYRFGHAYVGFLMSYDLF